MMATSVAIKLCLAMALAAFGLGFALGRRVGLRYGTALGLAEAPLRMRAESLREGRCVLCGTGAELETARPESTDMQNKGSLVRDNQPEVVRCPFPSAAAERPDSATTG